MGNAQYTSDVQCVVALYGIMDIGKLERQHAEYGVDPNEACSNDRSMGGMLLGKAPCKVPELVRFAKPRDLHNRQGPSLFPAAWARRHRCPIPAEHPVCRQAGAGHRH